MPGTRFGSSPRVWGIHIQDAGDEHQRRFIPTRVGNTHVFGRHMDKVGVHPHACGEYKEEARNIKHALGSSPRVWGIRRVSRHRKTRTRFIPTRVGNTESGRVIAEVEAVHPHACGEYEKRVCDLRIKIGSSPRVWGILAASPARGL